MQRERLIIIGNGMAPARFLQRLSELAPRRYDITVFGAEPHPAYDRIALSSVLAGDKRRDEITMLDEAWFNRHRVCLRKGVRIDAIDVDAREVVTEAGRREPFDRLIIATGSDPRQLPIPGMDLHGVLYFRNLEDVDDMIRQAEVAGPAVVIGGGLLGLEAAAGLAARGMEVQVVHLASTLMERQLDAVAGEMLKEAFRRRGISVHTGALTNAFIGDEHGQVSAVLLDDGRQLDAALVVAAVGVQPAIGIAEGTGLAVSRGIVVNDFLETSAQKIYALGECAEHRECCYGLVAPLYDMADVLASNLAGESKRYSGSQLATTLKVNGIDVFSAGDFQVAKQDEELVMLDSEGEVYKRIILKDNRIEGIVLYGDTAERGWLFDLMRRRVDVESAREALLFGAAYQGASTPGLSADAAVQVPASVASSHAKPVPMACETSS